MFSHGTDMPSSPLAWDAGSLRSLNRSFRHSQLTDTERFVLEVANV